MNIDQFLTAVNTTSRTFTATIPFEDEDGDRVLEVEVETEVDGTIVAYITDPAGGVWWMADAEEAPELHATLRAQTNPAEWLADQGVGFTHRRRNGQWRS